jgi:hypothetical protein
MAWKHGPRRLDQTGDAAPRLIFFGTAGTCCLGHRGSWYTVAALSGAAIAFAAIG